MSSESCVIHSLPLINTVLHTLSHCPCPLAFLSSSVSKLAHVCDGTNLRVGLLTQTGARETCMEKEGGGGGERRGKVKIAEC